MNRGRARAFERVHWGSTPCLGDGMLTPGEDGPSRLCEFSDSTLSGARSKS
jgi:hypothetical protein